MPDHGSGPNDFGFDYSYGYLCQRRAHTYYPSHLWRNGLSEPLPGNPGIDGDPKGLVAKAREIMAREHAPSPVARWNFQ